MEKELKTLMRFESFVEQLNESEKCKECGKTPCECEETEEKKEKCECEEGKCTCEKK